MEQPTRRSTRARKPTMKVEQSKSKKNENDEDIMSMKNVGAELEKIAMECLDTNDVEMKSNDNERSSRRTTRSSKKKLDALLKKSTGTDTGKGTMAAVKSKSTASIGRSGPNRRFRDVTNEQDTDQPTAMDTAADACVSEAVVNPPVASSSSSTITTTTTTTTIDTKAAPDKSTLLSSSDKEEGNGNDDLEMEAIDPGSKSDADAVSVAPRRSSRRRQATSRFKDADSEDDEYSHVTEEDEYSIVEDEEDVSFETEVEEVGEVEVSAEEEEWGPEDKGAWAKEAALYDSSLEESFSEYESDESLLEETDGWQSIQHKTNTKRKRKSGEKKRKRIPKPRSIRRDVDLIPELSAEQKKAELDKIVEEEGGEGLDLVTKFLICLLWDFNFRYTLMPHQHKGVLSVAGVDVEKLGARLLEMDDDSKTLLLNFNEKSGKIFRRETCSTLAFVKTRGILLADDMGLGKTVQGLGAAVLRNCITAIHSDFNEKIVRKEIPTVIVGPNRDVLDQWEESLLMSGVDRKRLKFFWPYDRRLHQGETFILITRHEIMSEMRNFMKTKDSNLFPSIEIHLLKQLENQYSASQSKCKNDFKEKDETESEFVTRVLGKNAHNVEDLFRTILIDEAHFLKNLVSYWGLGTALLGMSSQRSVPISGTPYNNGPQDMATLMTFIQPGIEPSKLSWWEHATEEGDSEIIAERVEEWRETYMIRRDKDVLTVKLPPKTVETCAVKPFSSELVIYEKYEGMFLKALQEFSNIADRGGGLNQHQRARQKDLFTMLMATMSLMRMSLIHPLLPGGREITIQFSPSRRHLISQLARDNKNRCVCCENLPGQKKSDEKDQNDSNKDTLTEAEAAALADVAVATEDEHLEDNSFGASNAPSGARDKASKKKSRNNFGDLIPMDPEFCHAVHECPHYVHKKCLIQLQSDCEDELKCPRCKDLHFRLHLAETKDDRHEVYCEHIPVGHNQQGITVTAKIGEIIKWAQEIPEGDKAIVYSFFKGGLDIIEGIFVEHLGIECARFDGDVTPDERSKELAKFKKSKTCRILLASVQSSGVGLNIVEANHVAFLDRWFNPCVHAQAEDRCHRLKQTKEVSVKYFDANMTVDQVMASINNLKKDNASILLADGTAIGANQNGVKYRDLSGAIGNMMKTVQFQRSISENISEGQIIKSCSEEALVSASQMTESMLKSRQQKDKRKSLDNASRDPAQDQKKAVIDEVDFSTTLDIKNVEVNFSDDWYVPPPKKAELHFNGDGLDMLPGKVEFSDDWYVPPPKKAELYSNDDGLDMLPGKVEFFDDDDDLDMLPGKVEFSDSLKTKSANNELSDLPEKVNFTDDSDLTGSNDNDTAKI